jgi:hypothetical protein
LEVIMRVLVTWGSKRGGTEGIARIIGLALKEHGFDVDMLPAEKVERCRGSFPHGLATFGSFTGQWLSSALIFAVPWAVGQVMSTMPWPKPAATSTSQV